MAKKDKFQQMKQGGGALSSFQDMVQQAATVAAIEQKAAANNTPDKADALSVTSGSAASNQQENGSTPAAEAPRFMRLPNPQIPVREYNLVSQYCNNFNNMTRQDFVELAIIEKLHNDGQMPDDEFSTRRFAIITRPPRGQRKGTKSK